jgi:hypothetical protein
MMGDLHGRLVLWWYLVRWWTPEAKAMRAFRQHSECVYCWLALAGYEDDLADELIQQAFLALHLEYATGRSIADPRTFAIDYARSAVNGCTIDEASKRANVC